MSKKFTQIIFILSAILIIVTSCSKKEARFDDVLSYADRPTFINNSILGNKVALKYQGQPIDFENGGTVVSGPGKFTFYNKSTGAVLLEQEFNLQRNKIDTLYFFQPDSTVAPQLIRNTQATEAAAPAGYFKLKIANLSKIALTKPDGSPYTNLDVIVKSNVTTVLVYSPIDTLIGMGSNLDTAKYYLIKRPMRGSTPLTAFKFSFIDHNTNQPLLNNGNTAYLTLALSASITAKNVYTVYLSDLLRPTANAAYISRNNAYYDISPNKIFE